MPRAGDLAMGAPCSWSCPRLCLCLVRSVRACVCQARPPPVCTHSSKAAASSHVCKYGDTALQQHRRRAPRTPTVTECTLAVVAIAHTFTPPHAAHPYIYIYICMRICCRHEGSARHHMGGIEHPAGMAAAAAARVCCTCCTHVEAIAKLQQVAQTVAHACTVCILGPGGIMLGTCISLGFQPSSVSVSLYTLQ